VITVLASIVSTVCVLSGMCHKHTLFKDHMPLSTEICFEV